MLYNKRTDLGKGIDGSSLLFFNHGFKCQNCVYNGCQHLTMLCPNISDITINNVKDLHYRFIIHNISKFEAINLLKNPVLED